MDAALADAWGVAAGRGRDRTAVEAVDAALRRITDRITETFHRWPPRAG